MNTNDLKRYRDSLISEKSKREASKTKREELINRIRVMIEGISQKEIEIARLKGFNIDAILNMDYNRLVSDDDYKRQLIEIIDTSVSSYIEESKVRLNIE